MQSKTKSGVKNANNMEVTCEEAARNIICDLVKFAMVLMYFLYVSSKST